MHQLLEELRQKQQKLLLGGGLDKLQKQHEKGKLGVWERILYLIDEGTDYIEIGSFAGDGQYEEHGGCTNGGVVIVGHYYAGV